MIIRGQRHLRVWIMTGSGSDGWTEGVWCRVVVLHRDVEVVACGGRHWPSWTLRLVVRLVHGDRRPLDQVGLTLRSAPHGTLATVCPLTLRLEWCSLRPVVVQTIRIL